MIPNIPRALALLPIAAAGFIGPTSCSGEEPESGGAPARSEPHVRPVPPPPPSWVPHESEVLPEAKVVAALIAEELTTYPRGGAERAAAAQRSVSVADAAGIHSGLIHPDAASEGRVVYPQLVGAEGDSAAITVLVRQTVRWTSRAEETELRVLDLRLRRDNGEWRLDGIPSFGQPGPSPPTGHPLPSPAAQAVLDHPRIHVPDTGRDDIRAGDVTEELLDLLLRIAERHEIHVLTLSGGRPTLVFGTDRTSRHARGRAVDIYKVDGIPVIEQRSEGTPAHLLVSWLFDSGIPEVGSPWALDGFGGRSFTDLVHQDHIHVGVGP